MRLLMALAQNKRQAQVSAVVWIRYRIHNRVAVGAATRMLGGLRRCILPPHISVKSLRTLPSGGRPFASVIRRAVGAVSSISPTAGRGVGALELQGVP